MAQQKNIQDPLNLDEAMSSSEAFIIKYKNKFLIAIAAVVVVVCAIVGYKTYIVEPREAKANDAIFAGQQYFANDLFEQALNGDSLGYKGFIAIAKEFSSTKAGNLANAYAGICLAQLGKYEEAIKYLDNFSASDELVNPAVKATMGNCYIETGKLEKGASLLIEAANEANSQALSPIYLVQAGQVLEKLGKNAEAVKVYTTVKEKYFNSYQAMEIDKYIERASIK